MEYFLELEEKLLLRRKILSNLKLTEILTPQEETFANY